MTLAQPSPPAPPSAEARARIRDENAALSEQLANRALRDGVAQEGADAGRAAAPPAMGVVRGADGVIVVTARDGRVIRIDPKAVGDEEAVRDMVQTALAPPAPPPDTDQRAAVAITGIVFTFVFLIAVVVAAARVFGRRAAARAATQGPAPDLGARLARIEQAIEAVAIEVERISESERYSARLLTERLPAAAPGAAPNGQGPAAPAAAPTLDAAR